MILIEYYKKAFVPQKQITTTKHYSNTNTQASGHKIKLITSDATGETTVDGPQGRDVALSTLTGEAGLPQRSAATNASFP